MIQVLKILIITLFAQTSLAQPLVIAHRGASGTLPEHSLAAVAAAHVMGVDYIEQDVVLSKDSIPVVLHDIHLETVTNVEQVFPKRSRDDGRFYAIDFTLKELKTLDLHERTRENGKPVYGGRFPVQKTGLKIPTLEEEIRLIQGMNKSRGVQVGIYVELKKPDFHRSQGINFPRLVLDVLKKYGYTSRKHKAYIQCFDVNTLRQIRKLTNLKLVQLVGLNSWNEADVDYEAMMTEKGLKVVAEYAQGIGPYLMYFLDGQNAKNKNLLVAAQKFDLEVHPFTFRKDALPPGFSTFESLLQLFLRELKVGGIFTDHPQEVLK